MAKEEEKTEEIDGKLKKKGKGAGERKGKVQKQTGKGRKIKQLRGKERTIHIRQGKKREEKSRKTKRKEFNEGWERKLKRRTERIEKGMAEKIQDVLLVQHEGNTSSRPAERGACWARCSASAADRNRFSVFHL